MKKEAESKCPICPKCGSKLVMATDAKCSFIRFIKEDGTVSTMPPIKQIDSSFEPSPYLLCRKHNCGFSYKVNSSSEHIAELDEWLSEHREHLWE